MWLAEASRGQAHSSGLTEDSQPLAEVEFSDLMGRLGPFEKSPVLAVAVSGGPDSLALTRLAANWAAARNGRVIGLTVDHGLRPGSADEARQTGHWLRLRGIEHHVLHWSGRKPTTGLQRRAREARYRELGAFCRRAGVLHLLTAHHKQDQAETVALRLAKGSGPNGLAAMAAVRELSGFRLLRPLLGVDKRRLTATLRHLGQDWIDDPSNQNLSFTRNRLRHEGIDVAGLVKTAVDQGRRRARHDDEINALLVRLVAIDPLGFAQLSADQFADLPSETAANLLARILLTIGGQGYPPKRLGLGRLLGAMRDSTRQHSITLAHCLVQRRKDHWLICRENQNLAPLQLAPNRWHVWDKRFLIRLRSGEMRLYLRQLGERGWSKREPLQQHGSSRDLPSEIRQSLPSIWRDETLLVIPHLGLSERGFDPSTLDIRFRPATPLGNAPFAAHI